MTKAVKIQKKKNLPELESSSHDQSKLSGNLTDNENNFRSIYKDCSDVIFRQFYIRGKVKAVLVYIEGMSSIAEIDDSILSPLMKVTEEKELPINEIIHKKVSAASVKEVKTISASIKEISSGNPLILVDKESKGFAAGLAKSEKRADHFKQDKIHICN